MTRIQASMLILLFAALFVLVFVGAQVEVPTVSAYPIFAFSNTASLTTNSCAGSSCHVASSSPGSAYVTGLVSPYTPGVTQHLMVTVNDPSYGAHGYLLTARLASNLGAQGGTFTSPDTNSYVQGPDIISNNTVTSTWAVDWTPPASGDVNFYLSGLATNTSSSNGDYQAMYTVKGSTAAATPGFSLSSSPSTLTLSQGGTGSSTITITPSGGLNPSSVTLSTTGLPAGLTANVGSVSGSSTCTITFNASSTAAAMTLGVTITGTSGALSHSTVVTVTVDPPASPSSLTAAPSSLTFNYGGTMPPSQSLNVSDSSATVSYSAATSGGGSWLSVNPGAGKTPSLVMVSVNPTGMSAGTYSGSVNLSATGATSASVPVTLHITSSGATGGGTGGGGTGGGGGSTTGTLYAQPHVYDPGGWSSLLSSQWVNNVGEPTSATVEAGLMLSKSAGAPTGSYAGASIRNFTGSLTEAGFDFLTGGQCTDTSPRLEVWTTDGITHVVGGCSKGTITTTNVPAGWNRVRFDLSSMTQTSPVITPGEQVWRIMLEMNMGPESGLAAAGGHVIIDKIDINGTFAGPPSWSRGD